MLVVSSKMTQSIPPQLTATQLATELGLCAALGLLCLALFGLYLILADKPEVTLRAFPSVCVCVCDCV